MLFYFVINLRGAPVSNRQRFIFVHTVTRRVISGGTHRDRTPRRLSAARTVLPARPHYTRGVTVVPALSTNLIRKKVRAANSSRGVELGSERRARAARRVVRGDWPARRPRSKSSLR